MKWLYKLLFFQLYIRIYTGQQPGSILTYSLIICSHYQSIIIDIIEKIKRLFKIGLQNNANDPARMIFDKVLDFSF